MNMKLLNSAALAATLALALPAHAAPPIIDSTGVKKTVVATMVQMTVNEVKNIVGDTINNNGGTLPPGYREVVVPTNPHPVSPGAAGSYNSLHYYQGLGYAEVIGGADCGGNLSPRILRYETCTVMGDNSCVPNPSTYFVCEPIGTRVTLEKINSGEVLNLSQADVNRYVVLPARDISTQAATAVCQAKGYTSFTQGTVVGEYFNGGCGQAIITQYRPGGGFFNGDLCYNSVLKSMQCYR